MLVQAKAGITGASIKHKSNETEIRLLFFTIIIFKGDIADGFYNLRNLLRDASRELKSMKKASSQ